jgi:hypothetical protein
MTQCNCCKKYRKKIMKLLNCEHNICIDCLCRDIIDVQFYDNFECGESLFCPCCFNELSRVNWTIIMDFLVYIKVLQPDILFDNQNRYHLIYNLYKSEPVNIDRHYSIKLQEFPVYI